MDMSLEELNRMQAEAADERHRPIIEAHKSGKSQVKIAAQFGVSRAWVQKVLARARKRGLI